MTAAATKAVFATYKRIPSRKVMQVVFEMPLESWPAAYRVLGEPSIETSQWFAIAKMDIQAEPAPTPKEQGSNLAANAALLVKEPAFQRFLADQYRTLHAIDPDEKLKNILSIKSKRELNEDPAAAARWRELRSEYEAWMRT